MGKGVDLHCTSRGQVSTCTVPPGDKCRPALCLQGTSVDLHCASRGKSVDQHWRYSGEKANRYLSALIFPEDSLMQVRHLDPDR